MKKYLTDLGENKSNEVITWNLNESQFLSKLGYDESNFSLNIDLKPSQKKEVSLYRLAGVWGHSGFGWTPLLVLLETIFVDHPVNDPNRFKKNFKTSTNGEKVHEFLYLRFDHNGGTANWGRSGWVNASLLWPDSLRYFMKVIQQNLADGDSF